MAAKLPTVVKTSGAIVTINGSDGGITALSAADILSLNLLSTLNRIVGELGSHALALSTGETSPIYFEDVTVSSDGKPFSLVHKLDKPRVRFDVVDWIPTTTGQPSQLERHMDATIAPVSDSSTLVLRSYRAGLATIRVW